MFAVIFEVQPRLEQRESYLGRGRMLRPELERIDGFVDNIRYASLTRPGWVLSLSGWRDEKALVRWRTQARHHESQSLGRSQIMLDYHLRVGELTHDTQVPPGQTLREQRLDETATGAGTAVTLIDARGPEDADADTIARHLGLAPQAAGLLSWDVFDAMLAPGDRLLLLSWRDAAAAEAHERTAVPARGHDVRIRRVRVVRDYGMFDRREAPQYFPEANDDRPTAPA